MRRLQRVLFAHDKGWQRENLTTDSPSNTKITAAPHNVTMTAMMSYAKTATSSHPVCTAPSPLPHPDDPLALLQERRLLTLGGERQLHHVSAHLRIT